MLTVKFEPDGKATLSTCTVVVRRRDHATGTAFGVTTMGA